MAYRRRGNFARQNGSDPTGTTGPGEARRRGASEVHLHYPLPPSHCQANNVRFPLPIGGRPETSPGPRVCPKLSTFPVVPLGPGAFLLTWSISTVGAGQLQPFCFMT